jgi:hypothetical protein
MKAIILLLVFGAMVLCGWQLFQLLDMGRNPEKYNGDDE